MRKLITAAAIVSLALSAEIAQAQQKKGGYEDYAVERHVPNYSLIGTGLILFAGPYAAGMAVAATSSVPSDVRLIVPVIGPWLDLADRPSCNVGIASCDTETTYKVLLVADGLAQGIGTLMIVSGLVFQQKEHVRTVKSVQVVPMHLGPGSVGAGVIGRF